MHHVYSSDNRGYIHFHPRFTQPRAHWRAPARTGWPFFPSSFLDIKAFNIEKRIAANCQIPRAARSAGREFFGINSVLRGRAGFNKSKRLPFLVARRYPSRRYAFCGNKRGLDYSFLITLRCSAEYTSYRYNLLTMNADGDGTTWNLTSPSRSHNNFRETQTLARMAFHVSFDFLQLFSPISIFHFNFPVYDDLFKYILNPILVPLIDRDRTLREDSKIRETCRSNIETACGSFHLWNHWGNTQMEISPGIRCREITNKAERRCLFGNSCNPAAKPATLKNNKSRGSWYQHEMHATTEFARQFEQQKSLFRGRLWIFIGWPIFPNESGSAASVLVYLEVARETQRIEGEKHALCEPLKCTDDQICN